nr:SH3 domain-containing protein [uncultured Eisenbergiella sp.]
MKKKVIAGLGIIIVIGAVAGGIFLFRGKGEDNSINEVASMETSSTMETEQEDKEESMESETAEPESVEETSSESEEASEEFIPEDITSQNEIEEAEVEIVGAEAPNVEESDIEPLDTTMYSRGTVNVRTGTSSTTAKLGTLTLNESVTVTGQSKSTNWYRVSLSDGQTGYVHPDYLSTTKTEVKQPPKNTNTNNSTENSNKDNNGGNSNNSGNTSNETNQSQNTPTTPPTNVPQSPGGQGKLNISHGDLPLDDSNVGQGVGAH